MNEIFFNESIDDDYQKKRLFKRLFFVEFFPVRQPFLSFLVNRIESTKNFCSQIVRQFN